MDWRKRLLLTQIIPISQIILDYYLLCESIEATILTWVMGKSIQHNFITTDAITVPPLGIPTS